MVNWHELRLILLSVKLHTICEAVHVSSSHSACVRSAFICACSEMEHTACHWHYEFCRQAS